MSFRSSLRSLRARYGAPARALVSAVQGLALFHVFWEYGYSTGSAAGPSMLPTFDLVGEWVVISKEYRRGRGVAVGDVVIYKIPIERYEDGVKRVVGMPGDYVLINSPESGSDQMVQVPAGHCWVVGDNLPASRDSRHFGPLPLALIRGKVIAKHQSNVFDYQRIHNPLEKPPGLDTPP